MADLVHQSDSVRETKNPRYSRGFSVCAEEEARTLTSMPILDFESSLFYEENLPLVSPKWYPPEPILERVWGDNG